MRKEEIIELNGQEYTLTLNRESFIRIDKICNVVETYKSIDKRENKYVEEISDDYNPFEEEIDFDKMDKDLEEDEKKLHNLIERAFFIWLYPVHKLNISQVKELLEPYFETNEQAEYIGEKYAEFMKASIEIKEEYEQERKNLKALANKK